MYDGLWFSPLKQALDAFIDSAQASVSGDVRLTLHGGRAVVTGRRSEASLYDFSLATYDEGDMFDQSLARGFVELWGLPSRLAAARGLANPAVLFVQPENFEPFGLPDELRDEADELERLSARLFKTAAV